METFRTYDPGDYYDELIDANGTPRAGSRLLVDKIESLPEGDLAMRQKAAEALLLKMGITFNVYGRDEGTEKIMPFDIIPRIVSGSDWQQIESGLKQRIFALNEFIQDVYNEKKILKDKVVPEDLVLTSRTYRKECEGFTPPRGIWCHVTGTDLVRDRDGRFFVLEDNLRCPSGVSYVLENRQVLKRTFPQVFEASRVRPVDDYPSNLLEGAGVPGPGPCPGAHHRRTDPRNLQQRLLRALLSLPADGGGAGGRPGPGGVRRIRPHAHHQRPQARGCLYRRIDDDFIDPEVFRPDSMLGVKGLIGVYKAGRIAMANAPGTGIADDKVIYAYVPKIIKYYTGEEAILPNVPTYICRDDQDRAYVLAIWINWWSRPPTSPAGTACWWAPMPLKRNGRPLPRRSRPNHATTWPSRPFRSPGCPPSWVTASRGATWICGPTCSSARRSTCSPAA